MIFSRVASLGSLASILSLLPLISAECTFSGGNYYCAETDAIIYQNVGLSSSYQDVTHMDESSCMCSQQTTDFSGSLAPFNEDLSVHFRGPIKLKQFGVYYPNGNSFQKRSDESSSESCQEGDVVVNKHQHKHKREVAVEYVEVTTTVFLNDNGESMTSLTKAVNTAPPAPAPETPAKPTTTLIGPKSTPASNPDAPVTSAKASPAPAPAPAPQSGDWIRSSYYKPGTTDNCVFMNHQGGVNGSGTWSSCFGNSISFADQTGLNGSPSPQPMGDAFIPSGSEFMIFSGKQCSGNGAECGYFRDGIPAYRGFDKSDKIFVFEFTMPFDSAGSGYNHDMPAIWLLNAKVPRTLQYGKAECSCWKSGCGEMDLFEILTAGSDKLISHVHDGQGGGTQDYFKRPSGGSLKAAVIFNSVDQTIHITEVDDAFDGTLSNEVVSKWLTQAGSPAVLP